MNSVLIQVPPKLPLPSLHGSNLVAPASPPASTPRFAVAGGEAAPRSRSPLNPPRLSLSGMILGAVASASLGLLYLFDPAQHAFYPICQFHALTGLYCPGCGSLRAIHQLFHLHIAAAFHFNALLVLAFPVLGWQAFRSALSKWKSQPPATFLPVAWLWLGFGIMIIFGVLRNLPFSSLSFLRP